MIVCPAFVFDSRDFLICKSRSTSVDGQFLDYLASPARTFGPVLIDYSG